MGKECMVLATCIPILKWIRTSMHELAISSIATTVLPIDTQLLG